ncbi:MAG: hypothetical protein ABH865_07780 [Candidatus Omnitrophota bacterium]|nr:hypothetical protein [Candidatus Omnitrophota bacterium]
MMKYFICIVLVGMATVGVYAEDQAAEYRDPFESVLPEETGPGTGGQESGEEITLPSITVEGIIFGVKMPQAIVDGDVYREGDTLKSVDAKIFKIEKNVVSLQYKGKIFEIGIQKAMSEQKEAQ